MSENPGAEPKNGFRDFFAEVEPLQMREPFAQTLGVFKKEDAVMEYGFLDVVKMAGHACPTTAGAYLCCRQALKSPLQGRNSHPGRHRHHGLRRAG